MLMRKSFIIAMILVITAMAAPSYADISNAAVLFLRIAPGARAVGMGEAFVAIADDAMATHWNPAGLGAYPLADAWLEEEIPDAYRPLKAVAMLKSGSGSDYMSYDVWAITPQGLARYNHREWNTGEIFSTKASQTVQQIVKSYFGVDDEERLAAMAEEVAKANNREPFDSLQALRDLVMEAVPQDYSALPSLQEGFDSVLAGYYQCLINWDKIAEVRSLFAKGMRDSTLSEMECDRINFAVEKARNRFIPEELTIPYAVLFDTELTALAATEWDLLVGTENGLYVFNGKRWRTLTYAEELPSPRILCLYADEDMVFIGTDSGVAKYAGQQVTPVGTSKDLPKGAVTAIGAHDRNDVWIVLNNDLYHWDGTEWKNYFEYTVVLDDTPEKIAEKFTIYGTPHEREAFLAKFKELNASLFNTPAEPETAVPDTTGTTAVETDTVSADSLAAKDTTAVAANPETAQPVEGETVAPDTAAVEPPHGFGAGAVVRVPFTMGLKGEVTSLFASFHQVWVGTSYGILFFDYTRWRMPGYRDYEVKDGETIADIVKPKAVDNPARAQRLEAVVKEINDVGEAPLEAGATIKVPRNPAAASTSFIDGNSGKVYFATTEGLFTYDGYRWSYIIQKGLDRTNAIFVRLRNKNLWVASEDKIVVHARGHTEFGLMYAKWLPELADDLYYGFAAGTFNTESWGTFGGSITFISYGRFARTTTSPTVIDEFDSFDIAFTGSYGTSLSDKLKGGISAKFIYSRLANVGAGKEMGQGTSTGFAIDLGLLYLASPRLRLGMSLTNLGPKMAYIDAAQSDELPRNLSLGFAYKLIRSDYYHFLVAGEVNKIMVGLGDGLKNEIKQVVLNGGAEFMYANTIAFRGGYIHDEEGKLKTFTVGVGIYIKNTLKFDFAYYFGSDVNESRKGIKPLTLTFVIP